jgi:hypothetical protein
MLGWYPAGVKQTLVHQNQQDGRKLPDSLLLLNDTWDKPFGARTSELFIDDFWLLEWEPLWAAASP